MESAALCFVVIFTISFQFISIINGDTDDITVSREEFYAVRNALNFKGKVVLITGSSSGIGATTARLFATLNAHVVVTGRNGTRIKEVVNDCYKLSPSKLKPLGLKLDLSITANIGRLVNETICTYGKIDILVNNAGIGNLASIQDENFKKIYEDVRAVNQDAPVEITRLSASYIQRTNGTIIFISSFLGRNPVTSTTPYSIAKGALNALALSLAQDLGPNVRVNVISPGLVDGTRIFRLVPPSVRPMLIKNQILCSTLQKVGVPMDIAKLVVFLASPLSSSLDGQDIHSDQGAHIPLLFNY